ncbi:MAG: queuosine precursor transporter [Lactobacillaceae bacterium]|jgi:uncharacterized integral membrane protein (TIGR00697 family)|nr:queuosine precursor transporter [Lactobacillaceae bacterium]
MLKFIKSNQTLGVTLFAATFFIAAWANINVALVIELPFHIPFTPQSFHVTFTAGDFVFPMAYILNDLAAEFFGKRKAIMVTVSANLTYLFFSVTTYLATMIPNESPEMTKAMQDIFAFSPRVAISSILALLLGTSLNAIIFNTMKDRGFGFKSRAWVSTLFGEVSDATSVSWLMFGGLPFLQNVPGLNEIYPATVIWSMVATQIVIKLALEAFMLPHTHRIARNLHKQMGDSQIA